MFSAHFQKESAMKAKIFNSANLFSGSDCYSICVEGKVHLLCYEWSDEDPDSPEKLLRKQNFGWMSPCDGSCKSKGVKIPPEVQQAIKQGTNYPQMFLYVNGEYAPVSPEDVASENAEAEEEEPNVHLPNR